MKTENNSKKVEKKIFSSVYSVYDITLDVEQDELKSGTRNLLTIDYRVACTSELSLSEFIRKLKSDPIETYSNHFFRDVPINSVVTVVMVDPSEYTIKNNVDSSALFILTCHENFRSNHLIKFNRNLIGYYPNIK